MTVISGFRFPFLRLHSVSYSRKWPRRMGNSLRMIRTSSSGQKIKTTLCKRQGRETAEETVSGLLADHVYADCASGMTLLNAANVYDIVAILLKRSPAIEFTVKFWNRELESRLRSQNLRRARLSVFPKILMQDAPMALSLFLTPPVLRHQRYHTYLGRRFYSYCTVLCPYSVWDAVRASRDLKRFKSRPGELARWRLEDVTTQALEVTTSPRQTQKTKDEFFPPQLAIYP